MPLLYFKWTFCKNNILLLFSAICLKIRIFSYNRPLQNISCRKQIRKKKRKKCTAGGYLKSCWSLKWVPVPVVDTLCRSYCKRLSVTLWVTLHAESANFMQRWSCFAVPLGEPKVTTKNTKLLKGLTISHIVHRQCFPQGICLGDYLQLFGSAFSFTCRTGWTLFSSKKAQYCSNCPNIYTQTFGFSTDSPLDTQKQRFLKTFLVKRPIFAWQLTCPLVRRWPCCRWWVWRHSSAHLAPAIKEDNCFIGYSKKYDSSIRRHSVQLWLAEYVAVKNIRIRIIRRCQKSNVKGNWADPDPIFVIFAK
jgi:hypothetical protein